jgi:hypothetical protein
MRNHFFNAPRRPYKALPVAIAAGMAIASVPVAPAYAVFPFDFRGNEYQSCASQLLSSGITPEAASEACAAALHPRDLARCVTRIDVGTPVLAEDALEGCKRVRRPLDLAECVTDIDRDTDSVAFLESLDYCRRSLLPLEFSDCVVGLRREIDLNAIAAMDVCIAADDRAIDYAPNLVTDDEALIEDALMDTPTQPSIRTEPSLRFTPLDGPR